MKKEDGKRIVSLALRYKYVILAAVCGIVILLLPSGKRTESEAGAQQAEFDRAAVQREMEEILGDIDGVGRLRLMLTTDASPRQELAQDGSLSYDGSAAQPENYARKSETVLVGSGGTQTVVVTRSVYPAYVGALVVCEGGGNAAVRLQVTQAVSALTGLGSEKISVIKGKP